MPTLLIRRGFGTRLVNEQSVERVPIAVKEGKQHFAKFGGFIDQTDSLVWSSLSGMQTVKINSVWGYSTTNGHWDVEYFGDHAVALGYFRQRDNTVSIPLFQGFPMVWCDVIEAPKPRPLAIPTNVIDLKTGGPYGQSC